MRSTSVGVLSMADSPYLKEIKGFMDGIVPPLPVPEGPKVGSGRECKGGERYGNGSHETVDGAVKGKGHAKDPDGQ